MSRLFCVVNAVDIDRIRDGKETEMKNVNQQYPKREHQRVADREDETESDRIYRRPARQSTSHISPYCPILSTMYVHPYRFFLAVALTLVSNIALRIGVCAV